METTELVEQQRPLICKVQMEMGEKNEELLLAEHQLTKTPEYQRVQELRTVLQGYQAQEQMMKDGIRQSLIAGGIKSVDTLTHKFTIKDNPPAVVIQDEEVIPAEYKKEKITITIDKTAIKNDIKAGNSVLGAYLSQSKSLLITPK
jgi:hypothetical protein